MEYDNAMVSPFVIVRVSIIKNEVFFKTILVTKRDMHHKQGSRHSETGVA
jgi:hypothetical protein